MTTTNYCAYNRYGIRLAVVYPHQNSWCVANHSFGGYPVLFKTVEAAKDHVVARHWWNLAEWREEEVQQ